MSEKNTNYTPAQEASIHHVGGPLLMSAGAGSGKTFTLQQRIAYALSPESGPAVENVKEILAITFTKKAAAEVKSRVRSELMARGMRDQALLVDDSWIGNTHSVCEHILRAHALELGIDPDFEVMDEADAEELLQRAFSIVLGRRRREGDAVCDTLAHDYGFKMASNASLPNMAKQIIRQANLQADGFDSITCGEPVNHSNVEGLRALLVAYEAVAASSCSESEKNTANTAIGMIHGALSSSAAEVDSLEDDEHFIAFLSTVPVSTLRGNKDKELREKVQRIYADIACSAYFSYSAELARDLVELAREVSDEYERLKAEARAVDLAGLVKLCLNGFRDHPQIAEGYRSQFKLVMVDEFQDTNHMQEELVRLLCGENLSNLCTVGDSQQSIYRFLNADVNVYTNHKQEMRSPQVGALCSELSENFRSHTDILSFVRKVCGQPDYFIEEFLDLKPARDESRVACPYQSKRPRVQVQAVDRGFSIKAARAVEANAIASWFAELRDAGHSPDDMVLLMGKTTDVETYAQALRDYGLPCMITGGNAFYQTPEVGLVEQLLKALANPADTEALYEILTGELVRLSASDLLWLATLLPDPAAESAQDGKESSSTPGKPRRCDLDRRLPKQLPENASPCLCFAAELLESAWEQLGVRPPSKVVMGVLEDSGYLARLYEKGINGRAVAANLIKAVKIIRDIEEKDGFDIARVSRRFSWRRANGKEKMGTLIGGQEGIVRIMTTHSSKGLEFPIVAVASCYDVDDEASCLEMTAVDGRLYLSLQPGKREEWKPVEGRVAKRVAALADSLEESGIDTARAVVEARDAGELKVAIRARCKQEAYFEAKRLFYVAATRAAEALNISFICKVQDYQKGIATSTSVINDILLGLFGEETLPDFSTKVDYAGTEPLDLYLVTGDSPYNGKACGERGEASRLRRYPQLKERPRLATVSSKAAQQPVFSYSSIAEGDEGMQQAMASKPRVFKLQEDEATSFGAAFHQLARFSVLKSADEAYESVDRMISAYSIEDAKRLYGAVLRWTGSELFACVQGFEQCVPELSFCLPIKGEDGSELFLDGDMDLYCYNTGDGAAPSEVLIVDFKTGGDEDEDLVMLQGKHLLQAQCYAYAALTQGAEHVSLAFARVEFEDPEAPGQPQLVTYEFSQEDLPEITRTITQVRNAVEG